MQTGTTPTRRIATEPPIDRSAPGTGPCRTPAGDGLGRGDAAEVTA